MLVIYIFCQYGGITKYYVISNMIYFYMLHAVIS